MVEKYYSEKLDKVFDTKADCVKAEKEYDERQALVLAKKEERAREAKEVEEALEDAVEAYNKYVNLRNDFVKKHGSYHHTSTTERPTISSIIDVLFDSFL